MPGYSECGIPMKVLLMCTEDRASVNIRDRLLEEGEWEIVSEFSGRPVRANGELLLYEKEGLHLYLESIDKDISDHIRSKLPSEYHPANECGYPLDLLVFLSKHRSETGTRSLTVHPPGNYLQADYGGSPKTLPPSAPLEMTAALKTLYAEKKKMGIKDRTTYEVTHHGPEVSSPCFFIEIGSGPDRWEIPELGRAIARALLSDDLNSFDKEIPIALGIGGGHYAPRFTDRAMRGKFAFGHMIPDYILSEVSDTAVPLELAKRSTPGAEYLFVHRSGSNKDLLEGVEEAAKRLGLSIAD
jgi:D-aminoacyl-tRNA deacylase